MNWKNKRAWLRKEMLFHFLEALTKVDFISTEVVTEAGVEAYHSYRFLVHGRAWQIRIKELAESGELVLKRVAD